MDFDDIKARDRKRLHEGTAEAVIETCRKHKIPFVWDFLSKVQTKKNAIEALLAAYRPAKKPRARKSRP